MGSGALTTSPPKRWQRPCGQADAEHRQTAVADHAGAHTEVAVSVGPTRAGRDYGGIELVESEVGPRRVVPHDVGGCPDTSPINWYRL
jgi:hypothetical protein